ncbi:hypothetical protein [Arenimonas daejeonensis]|uniref:hypothetical protein n=1 Tax=Arenimonas daejeonensis TaxID=370777 RepID=UPI0013150D4B|nr:hypothetical protein [Arenimonas daejeonensis]
MNKSILVAVCGLIVLASVTIGVVVSPAYGLGFGLAAAASLAVGAFARRRQDRRG